MLINRDEVMIIGTQCTSGRTLNTDADSDSRRFRKTFLTEFGVESGEIPNIKVIDIFETLP
jgi:hypothetical protein